MSFKKRGKKLVTAELWLTVFFCLDSRIQTTKSTFTHSGFRIQTRALHISNPYCDKMQFYNLFQ